MKKLSLAGLLIALAATSCVSDIPTSDSDSDSEDKGKKTTPTEKVTPKVKSNVTVSKEVINDNHVPVRSGNKKVNNLPTSDLPALYPEDKLAGFPWDEKLAQAIRLAEKYNCMPNTISMREELSPFAKAELDELYSMAIILANIHADDALRLVDHPCPTVRIYALMALRSWGAEHYSQEMLKNIPKLQQMNVCSQDDVDRSLNWMKGVIEELHEIPNSPPVTKDSALQKKMVGKAEAFVRQYAQFPGSYISLSETTPAYPRCQKFVSNEGIPLYYLELVCFLNDRSGKQHKLLFHFQFDENLEISPSLPFSSEFCRNLTPKERAVFYPEEAHE